MAASQWRHAAIMVVASVVVIYSLTDSADAWCPSGYKDCDHNYNNGCETAVKSDVKNCGDCGVTCPTYPYSSPTCTWGNCGYTCNNGWKDCDYKKANGCEANINSDVNNCGSCGVHCKTYPYSTAKCTNGNCVSVCNPGWKDCNYNVQDGCETDVGKDIKNCGGCGVKCNSYPYSTPTCSNGVCGYTCNPGWKDCDYNKQNGCETNVNNDVHNCGGCGTKCPCNDPYGQATCSNGSCGVQCKSGYKYDNYQKKCVYIYH